VPAVRATDRPLALRLDIGLPPTTPLLDQRDLDSYLFPPAVRTSKATGTRLVSVWGTKQHSAASFARIELAVPLQAPAPGGLSYTVRTDRSSQITAFKWKPTIDALGQILGSTSPGRSWHPQDGRIVVLGLHCQVDHALGNEVLITIEANTHQI
jgi:hypothetical protein